MTEGRAQSKSAPGHPQGRRSAVVIGGSISGLYAALMLQRHGWQVDVYERTPGELAGRGAGIVAQPELRTALAAAGIGDVGEVGVHVEYRILLDAAGRKMMQVPCPQTVTSWERVHRLLRARLADQSYHAGSELRRIELLGESSHERARCHFTDGRTAQADLVIGADGIRSTVRQQLFPEARVEYAGYVAWRSLVDERAFSKATHDAIFWRFAFGLPPGEQFIGYPVTGPADEIEPGCLRYNFVWYRPADEATDLQRLLTDATGRVHALSIPPPLIRPEARAELRRDAARLLAPQFQEVVSLAAEPFLQPIYDLDSADIAAGPVAIIGDAAFVARPHVAAGVIKAADDVLTLVAALDAEPDVARALARYQAERVPIGRRIVARARAMGANYRPASMAGGAPRLSAADPTYARSVVEDTALTSFLREP